MDMKKVICPLDGKFCAPDCPDRYPDGPGCALTTSREMGAKIVDFGGGDVGIVFLPGGNARGR